MKNLVTLLVLFVSVITFGQKSEKSLTDINVTGITYTLDSVEELETINWSEIEEVLQSNDEEEIIELSFVIDLKKSKNKLKSSFTIRDKAKNLDNFIEKGKKGVESLIRLSNKHKD